MLQDVLRAFSSLQAEREAAARRSVRYACARFTSTAVRPPVRSTMPRSVQQISPILFWRSFTEAESAPVATFREKSSG